MSTYSKILSLISGVARTVDLSQNTLSLLGLQINGSTSGNITQLASPTTTNYSITWPAAQGATGTFLQNTGSGTLAWTAVSSSLIFADSLVNTLGTVTLVNDNASPGNTKYYGTDGSGTLGYYSIPSGSGTVSSVAFADDSSTPIYNVSGSPVTTTGTLAITLATQSANTIFSGPASGSAAQPGFRTLVSADIPNNAANTTGTASDITTTSNSTLVTLSSLSLPTSQLSGTISLSTQASGTLQAAQFPALTGDITTTVGSLVTTLATVNSNVGSFGSSTSIPSFTVNAKGLITAASGNAVVAPAGTLSGTTLNSSVVSSSLTSVGTISSGTWAGTSIAIAHGGTGQITASAAFNALSPITATGDLIVGNGTNSATKLAIGSTGQILTVSGGTAAWAAPASGGTVTSVALSDGSSTPIYSISGSPVTASGTLTFTLSTQSANTVLAGPSSGSAAQPGFRSLVASDIPSLSATYVTQSEVGVANGVASLNGSGKIPLGQLPADVFLYQGTWNPSTNTPTLVDGTGTAGYVYWISTAFAGPVTGLNNASMINFQIGDLALYNGTQWELTTPAAGVSSVNGAQGAVTVNAINQLTGDVTASAASGSQSKASSLVATTNATLATLSGLTSASSLATVGTITSGTWNGTTIAIANGGTGQTSKQAAFDALSPLVTAGDTLYYNGFHNVNLPIGSTGNILTVVAGEPAWAPPATSGTVTSFAFTNQDNVTGTVSNSTSTPTLSLAPTSSTPSASSFASWDANSNISANNLINNYTTTVNSGTTVTLTAASTYQQYFTGTAAETVKLPAVSTVPLGTQYLIVNTSTNTVSVQTSGATSLQALSSNTQLLCTSILTSGTTGFSLWALVYSSLNPIITVNGSAGLGGVVTVNAINQLTGDVTASAASGSQSKATSLVATTNATLVTLSGLTSASSLATVGTITTGTWNGTTIAIANGGTGQTSKQASFDALSPLGTAGDTLYYNGSHNVNLPIGSTGNVLTVVAGEPAWAAATAITALTGQVTASGPGSVVATIATNTVTNSNLSQIAGNTIKGNNTGSTANAADLTTAQVLTMLGIFSGKTSISSAATSQAVTFSTAYANSSYSITANLLNTTDSNPQFQPVTITAQSTTGFTATWNAATATANYVLSWQAIANN